MFRQAKLYIYLFYVQSIQPIQASYAVNRTSSPISPFVFPNTRDTFVPDYFNLEYYALLGVIPMNTSKRTCPQCNRIFSTKQNADRHYVTVHLQQRNIECPVCGVKFGLKYNMLSHLRRVHYRLR